VGPLSPEPFGPPPFRFTPTGGAPIAGAAYSVPFRILAGGIVAGATVWAVALWWAGKVPLHSSTALWFLAALAMMIWTGCSIVRSVTTIAGDELRQTWMWTKRMELRELAYGRLIRVRGLEWLIAPRLYVRTLLGKFAVFYLSDPRLVADAERLVRELSAFRRQG
jgi:hypothetical protein